MFKECTVSSRHRPVGKKRSVFLPAPTLEVNRQMLISNENASQESGRTHRPIHI